MCCWNEPADRVCLKIKLVLAQQGQSGGPVCWGYLTGSVDWAQRSVSYRVEVAAACRVRAQSQGEGQRPARHQVSCLCSAQRRHSPLPQHAWLPCRERAKNPEEGNSVAELYLQAGADTAELRAKVDLLEQVCFLFQSATRGFYHAMVQLRAKVDLAGTGVLPVLTCIKC
jgi:hypothetical protein